MNVKGVHGMVLGVLTSHPGRKLCTSWVRWVWARGWEFWTKRGVKSRAGTQEHCVKVPVRWKNGLKAKELLLGMATDRGGKAQEVRTSAQD